MVIREAGPADADFVCAALVAMQADEVAVVGPPLRLAGELRAKYAELVMQAASVRDALVLVAENGGNLCGLLVGWLGEGNELLVEPGFNRFALISDLYVTPEARRGGVARALLDEGKVRLRAHGLEWVRIVAKSANAAAMEAYVACGFEAYETVFVSKL